MGGLDLLTLFGSVTRGPSPAMVRTHLDYVLNAAIFVRIDVVHDHEPFYADSWQALRERVEKRPPNPVSTFVEPEELHEAVATKRRHFAQAFLPLLTLDAEGLQKLATYSDRKFPERNSGGGINELFASAVASSKMI